MNIARFFIYTILLSLLVGGCAKKPTDPAELAVFEQTNDPLEPWNRFVWKANLKVDKYTLKPLAKGYRAITPEPFRMGIRNAYDNITEPWSFINNILQGQFGRAGRNLGRLIINSTVGIAGLFDAATDLGVPSADEDLGQTFAKWGIGEGPFLMVPFLGPSNPRDLVGFAGQSYADPVGFALRREASTWTNIGVTAGGFLVQREQVLDQFDSLVEESQDSYAAIRSGYRQNRVFEIYNGDPPIDDEFDPFADDF
ncbi:MAG: VacJ family lipoprotein [Sphingomonadales bacterium]